MENLDIPPEYLKNLLGSSTDIESLSSSKVESLKEVISEIEDLIKERETLSLSFIKEAEKMKTSINNFLLENAPKGENDSEFARERAELRKKQMDISELQLNERVGSWRDIALLKKELREREKDFREKQSRTEMLSKILEEENE